jgi:hypothetical protein
MKQRMKESYRKGIANHPGPEPCEGGREAALEALDRGTCRLCIELRNRAFSGGRQCHATRKATGRAATNASRPTPCGAEDQNMYGSWAPSGHARTGRPRGRPWESSTVRWEKAMSYKTQMNGGGESYSGIVPAKHPNPCRTLSRESGPNGLDRVREAAKRDGATVHRSTAPCDHRTAAGQLSSA